MPRILSSKMAVAIGLSALLSSAATFSAMSAGHRHEAPEPASFAARPLSAFATPVSTFHDASVPEASSVVPSIEAGAAIDCF